MAVRLRPIRYSMLPAQRTFHASRKPKVFMSAGYGAGKSYALVMKLFQLCHINRGLPGGLLCPTLTMFRRDILPLIREICEENGIPYSFHKTEYYFTFPDTGSTVYVFHAEDDGRSIRGPNLAFFCINEVTLITRAAFDAALGRVRLKAAKLSQIACSGTPEGFNWDYDYFIAEEREDTDVVYGRTRDNIYNSADYVSMLEGSYDDIMVQQFVEGKYVNTLGRTAVYAFDRRIHVNKDLDIIEHMPIWVSMDFNVDPMSAVLWHPFPKTYQVWLHAFDEIKLAGSNTYEMCRAITERIGIERRPLVTIFPDPAGRARSTKTKMPISDIDILKQNGFPDIRFKSRINVRDSLNATNNLFQKNRILVSPKCKEFIKDLEQCKIKEGIYEIDKKDSKRTHWLDGAKNMIDHEFPVIRPSQHRSQAR